MLDDGSMYAFGCGSYGQLGLGHERSCSKPHKIESDVLKGGDIVSVACGVRHTLCLDDRGRVFSFGHGANGRLGHGDEKDRLSPTLSRSLEALLKTRKNPRAAPRPVN